MMMMIIIIIIIINRVYAVFDVQVTVRRDKFL